MKKSVIIFIAIISSIFTGCATSANPNDPYEAWNRPVFAMNMTMDTYVLRPTTVAYTYIPEPIRDAIANFFGNLRDFVSLANDILQLDGMNTMQTFMRVSINSTFGILGLIDVSTSLGLPEYKNTFGNTMQTWGWTDSSYFLVPFLGPGTLRDQIGVVPDVYYNPLFWLIKDDWISYSIFAMGQLDNRATYLGQDEILEQSLDPYATVRDLYLQQKGYYKFPIESTTQTENSSDASSMDELINEENESSTTINKLAPVPVNNVQEQQIDELINEENNS